MLCTKTQAIILAVFSAKCLPMEAAMEDPMRFFDMLRSTRAEVEVLRTDLTTWAGTTASATTDLPRPSIQLIAAGFLSKNIYHIQIQK